MSEINPGPARKLTLIEAIKDFGWLPLLLVSIGGGLALIDIAERAVFDGLTLATPFQIVLDGYNRITAVIAAIVEPLIRPLLDGLNQLFAWNVQLQPHWRSVFLIVMIFVMALVRSDVRAGWWGRSVFYLIAVGCTALLAALLVGVMPLDGGWWTQGLTASLPMVFVLLSAFVSEEILSGEAPARTWRVVGPLLFIAAFMFGIAALLSQMDILTSSAGIVVLAIQIALLGALALFLGLQGGVRTATGLGLSMLGGFFAGGLILLSNAALVLLPPLR